MLLDLQNLFNRSVLMKIEFGWRRQTVELSVPSPSSDIQKWRRNFAGSLFIPTIEGSVLGKNSCGKHFSSARSITTKSYSFGLQANCRQRVVSTHALASEKLKRKRMRFGEKGSQKKSIIYTYECARFFHMWCGEVEFALQTKSRRLPQLPFSLLRFRGGTIALFL